MKEFEVKEKLDQVCPDSICLFYGIPVSNFSKQQLENLVYLLISSAMDKDEKKIWCDNGFKYHLRERE